MHMLAEVELVQIAWVPTYRASLCLRLESGVQAGAGVDKAKTQ